MTSTTGSGDAVRAALVPFFLGDFGDLGVLKLLGLLGDFLAGTSFHDSASFTSAAAAATRSRQLVLGAALTMTTGATDAIRIGAGAPRTGVLGAGGPRGWRNAVLMAFASSCWKGWNWRSAGRRKNEDMGAERLTGDRQAAIVVDRVGRVKR